MYRREPGAYQRRYPSFFDREYPRVWGAAAVSSSAPPVSDLSAADILGANLKAWFAANCLSTGLVETWNDISGNSKNLTQATSGNRPNVGSATLNSMNVVQFQATSANYLILDAPFSGGDTKGSLYIVLQNSNGYGDYGFTRLGTSGSEDHYLYAGQAYTSALSNTRRNFGPPTSVLSYHILGIQSSSGSWKVFYNGAEIYSTGTNNPFIPSTNSTELRIGRSIGGWYFDGRMAEIIFTNNAESTFDRQRVEGYLAHKWGLTSVLSSNHPYKTVKPTFVRYLEDGTSVRLLEDGTSKRSLE